MPKSRRKPSAIAQDEPDCDTYCRKCMEYKTKADFYQATDYFLDSNGYMSICKDCVQLMMERALRNNENKIEKALLDVCRILSIRYEEEAVATLVKGMNKAEREGTTFNITFGRYLTSLPKKTEAEKRVIRNNSEFIFVEPQPVRYIAGVPNPEEVSPEEWERFTDFWGSGLDLEDYLFLENEYARWIASTQINSNAELVVLREICHLQNEVRRLRRDGKSTKDALTNLNTMMKSGSLTPNQQNAAMANANYETFGNWIKMIEKTRPAELFEDVTKFSDIDGMHEYAQNYIVRPLKNFITQSRDFKVNELGDLEEDPLMEEE